MASIFAGKIIPAGGGLAVNLVIDQQAGVASYTTGGDSYTIPGISDIKAVIAAQISGGFVAIVDGFTAGVGGAAGTVELLMFESGVADAALGELNNATNISGETVTLTVIGG